MKTKNLLLGLGIALVLIFALNFVSANFNVTYNVYSAVWENSTYLNRSNDSVTGVSYLGFICTAPNCSSFINTPLVGLSGTTNSTTSSITVSFPEVRTTQARDYGYLIYFYKDGFIGWEKRNESAWGNGTANGSNVYLSKKRTGYAPISDFNVVNSINVLKPLEVNVTTAMDAETYAAIKNRQLSGLNVSQYEQVNTTITLDILNSNGGLVTQLVRNILIPYSGNKTVYFNYTFLNNGSYTLRLYSNVTDAKIINPISYSPVSRNLSVIQPNLTNYSYGRIQTLVCSPLALNTTQSVTCNVVALANFVDPNNSSNLIPVNFTIDWRISNSTYLVYSNSTFQINPSSGYVTYSMTYLFNSSGEYTITARVSPNVTFGNHTLLSELASQTIVVGENTVINYTAPVSNNTSHHDHSSDDEDTFDDEIEKAPIKTLSGQSKGGYSNLTLIDINGPRKVFNYRAFLWVMIILIIILLVLILFVLFFKSTL